MSGSAETQGCPTVPRHEGKCFLVICRDAPGQSDMRETHLGGHLAHVEANWTRYLTAGPIRIPGEKALVGSIFLVFADDLQAAKTLMEGDPYVTSGLYGSVEYFENTLSIGQFIGGKIWPNAEAIAHLAKGG
jgi:uncharacterized protein YciI